jgi:Uncharacterized conserved protein
MRKLLTPMLLLACFCSNGQQFNNEWIRFEQAYYKIKVATAGLYRVPKTVLDDAGIGNTQVQNFELWRNGERVPFYTSVSNGTLPANGYIEFWGEPNDGKPDKPLYRDPAYQHTDVRSLQTDTAIYFLSVNTNQSGFKVVDVTNNVQGNTLPEEPFFMSTVTRVFNRNDSLPNMGLAAVVGTYVYSSSYDKGEFFSTRDITPSSGFTTTISSLNVHNSGPGSTIRFGAAGNALNQRSVRLRVNNTDVVTQEMDFFNDLITAAPLPTALISSGSAKLDFLNTSGVSSDRYVVSFVELTYPRTFNFGGVKNFKFTLPARSSGYFLRISNFNHTGVDPVLYDITNGERFIGDRSASGFVQFALPGTANDRTLVLASQDAANVKTVTAVSRRVFNHYKENAHQGDYLIISNSSLFTGTGGNNPVADYKAYRESTAGGGFKVQIADIDELVDQFAFGIKKHPLSIRNYLRYCRTYFAQPPKFVLLIGRGMNYAEYQRASRQPGKYPLAEELNLVPTFGNPASDNLLSADDINVPVATTPIGRLPVISGREIEDYLEKLKEYEQAQKSAPATIEGRKWMKNVVHVTGSSDAFLGTVLCNYMNVYEQIIEDTLFGGKVSSFCKQSTNPVEQLSNEKLNALFSEGVSMLTYFGHSSATTLEFNIDNPQAYSNRGKYPVFFVNGCNAGNFYTYFPQRMQVNETLSEKFVLAKQCGSIGFVASTHYGIVNYLNLFLINLYKEISGSSYGHTLGETNRNALQKMILSTGPTDFYARFHAETISLNGDPAVYLNTQPKPDYAIDQSLVVVNPSFISVAERTFKLKVKVANLGRALSDSIVLEVKQQYPDGTTAILYRERIPGVRETDSIMLDVPIVSTRDKGQNKIFVSVDADSEVDEISENNNTVSRDIFIFEDEARPVYPYNYAIISDATQKLYASTANPLSTPKTYLMELDTSGAFSSSSKVRKTVTAAGGIIEFDHGLHFIDSTVYYWRISPNAANEADLHWNNASFMYINGSDDGFNQSTYFQNRESELQNIILDSASNKWKFGTHDNSIFINNGVFPSAAREAQDFSISVNGSSYILSVCGVSGLYFSVFDSTSLQPWYNGNTGQPGRFGSDVICGDERRWQFQYNYTPGDTAKRRKIVEFMDAIPPGSYVVVKNIFDSVSSKNTYISRLMADTANLGSNNSLYHKLLEQGFTGIDSMYKNRSFIFLYQKDRQRFFTPRWVVSNGINDRITLSATITTPDTVGIIKSPKYGPAKKWQQVLWDGNHLENPSHDNPVINVVGVDNNNVETVLYTLDRNVHSFDLSNVDVEQYPYIQLQMRNIDSVDLTPFQLKYWRVLYDPAPEGGIASNIFLLTKDTVEVGEPMKIGVAFKNISKTAFDSLRVKASILDANNTSHEIPLSKYKPVISGDTITIQFDVETRSYPGHNNVVIEVNPENDQPEQYHFNNILYHQFYVKPDVTNPVLDVTFDGVHILNRDIVSAKPHIQIKLKDEAKHMLLDDTTVSSVEVRYPNGVIRTFNFDGDTLRFIPATSGSDNTAVIDFTPAFLDQTNPEGDEYELIVNGKDKSQNRAGDIAYRVAFKVIAKPMISNLLNYPNPFSTSTAFVFTLTGSEIPQNIRIQILTVTGKIVREITMNELGPIRIGRNITEFKWDGTDQYGQKLANGVYLYRVITSMNGKPMEKYKAQGDNTDKYFNNGYGKMYLMR